MEPNDELELENQTSPNTDETDVDYDTTNVSDDTFIEETPVTDDISERIAALEEQNRRLYARLKKQDAKRDSEKEEPKPEPKEKPKETEAIPTDDLIRARLDARGYLDETEQDEIIRASKALGLSPIQGINDPIIKMRIEQMRTDAKTNDAIPSPSGKSGATKHGVSWYIEKGELPEDSEMFDKVQAELKRQGKSNLDITNPND